MTDQNFIAGSGGGGKGGGNSSKTAPDSLDSRSHAKIIDVISEGEIEGLYNHNNVPNANAWQRSVFLNDTPIMNSDGSLNFDDVTLHVRGGTASQDVVPGFETEASSPTSVNSDVTQSGVGVTFQITDTSVDAVTLTIGVPVLQKIKKNGDTEGTSFRYTIEKQQHGGSFVFLGGFNDTDENGNVVGREVKGRTPDLYQDQHTFQITGNTFPVTFRVRRTTADDSSLNLDDLDLISHQSTFKLVSFQEIKFGFRNQNATYSQSGQVIEINAPFHNLIVGDSVKLTFNSGTPSKPTNNINATQVTQIVSRDVFRVGTSVSQTITSGSVSVLQIFNYPNSALVGMRIDAEQFSSIPKRAFRVRGTKVRIPASNSSGNVNVDPNNGRIIYDSGYVFNGVLQAAKWTTDPAWCLYDLLVSRRYGLGDEILTDAEKANFSTGVASNLDIYSFYSVSQYCSEEVTFKFRLNDGTENTITEPRFSLNGVIRKREDAFKIINTLCSVFRGMAMYTAGKLSLIQDRKGQDTSFLFTLANVTPDGFQYSSSSVKTRTTVAVVKYLDLNLRDTAYEEVLDEVAISKYGVNTKNIDAFGCTSRYQARRLGRWLLYSLANETESVAFTTTLEAGALCRPGQIIEIADPVRAGVRRAGRIMGVNGTNQITIDDTSITDLPADGVIYTRTLHVIMPNGTVSTNTVASISGNTITIVGNFTQKIQDSNNNTDNYFLSTTNTSYNFNEEDYVLTTQTVAPNLNSIWILETTQGTGAENIETQKFKVVGVEEKDDFTYQITAITHNESKYDHAEQLETLQFRDFTNLNEIPAPPAQFANRVNPNGSITKYPIEQLYRFRDTIRIKIIVGWQPVLGVNRYEVKYRQDSGNFKTVVVNGSDFEISDVIIDSTNNESRFDFEVRSINAAGVRSSSPLTTKTQSYLNGQDTTTGEYFLKAIGKSAPPSDVSGFSGTIDPHIGIVLNWNAPTPTPPNFADLDIEQYEIKSGSWSTGTSLGKIKGTTFKVGTIPPGTTSQIFSIKAFDADGNQSVNAQQISLTITAPSVPQNGSGTFFDDNLILKWDAPASGSYAIEEYEIYQGAINNQNLLGRSKSTTFQLPVNFDDDVTFNIRAVDIAGNLGQALNFTVVYVVAAAPNIEYQYENTQLRLFWNLPNSGSTKIKEYEIKISDTDVTNENGATFVTRVSSRSFLLDVTWNTSKRFWIAAVNSNNKFGAFGRTGITNYPDVTFENPPMPTGLTAVLVDESAKITWTPVVIDQTVRNGLPIADYKIYRSAGTLPFANAVLVAQQNGTQITEKWIVDVIGGVIQTQKTYYIQAVDTNGNVGQVNSIDITANPPEQISRIDPEVIDNNVLLRWPEPASDLPIIYYNIYRTSFTAGNLIGAKQGGFTTVFEQIGGEYTYLITAVNSAKVEATQARDVEVDVDEPPDFVLNAERSSALLNGSVNATYTQANDTNTDQGLIVTVTKINHGLSNTQQLAINFTSGSANGTNDDSKNYVIQGVTQNTFQFIVGTQRQTQGNITYSSPATFTNGFVENNTIFFCIDSSKQYRVHFDPNNDDTNDNGFNNSTGAKITFGKYGGSTAYAIPSENSASFQETFDFGTTIPSSRIQVKMNTIQTIGEGVNISPQISTSLDGTNFTNLDAGQSNVLGTNFRYVKTIFTLSASGNNDLIQVNNISYKLFLKQLTDQGSVTVSASEAASGKQVNFFAGVTGKSFLDVDSISLQIRGSSGTAKYAIYDFLDEPTPTGFKIFLYDASGNAPTGTNTVDFTVRGV
tara:strand:+ start:3059 stop:8371 length:5313 start_codon:yes stop_codon:yes gene_type:complete